MSSERPQHMIQVPSGTLIAYKILPSDFDEEYLVSGQTEKDWSAVYAQFNIEHAVSYLPNHFDRGHQTASLTAIFAKSALQCILFKDQRIAISELSSVTKANYLAQFIQQNIKTEFVYQPAPLLKAIGDQMDAFVVLYDMNELECAIPHCMMTNDNFQYVPIVRFIQDASAPWAVKDAYLINEGRVDTCMDLSRDERWNYSQLGIKVRREIATQEYPEQLVWIGGTPS